MPPPSLPETKSSQSKSCTHSVSLHALSSTEKRYPSFGEIIGNPHAKSLKRTVAQIAILGTVVIATVAVSSLTGTFGIGLIASGAIVLAVVICKIAVKVFRYYQADRFCLAFKAAANNTDAPSLGKSVSTDLRVSNHATESFEWKKELIRSAQSSIELSANFAGGHSFRQVLRLIEKRMKIQPDLKVHLLLSRDLLEPKDLKYLKFLKKHYPHFVHLITDRIYTTVPEVLSEENHVKTLIVDGQYFVMGGTGISDIMSREIAPHDSKKQDNLRK